MFLWAINPNLEVSDKSYFHLEIQSLETTTFLRANGPFSPSFSALFKYPLLT